MKIMLFNLISIGGMAHYTSEIANEMANCGHKVTVVAPDTIEKRLFSRKVELHLIENFGGLSRIKNIIVTINPIKILNILNIIKSCNPEVISITSLHPINPIVLFFAKKTIVYTCHDPQLHLGESFMFRIIMNIVQSICLRVSQAIITHGESLKEIIKKKGVPESKIYVVQHGEYSCFKKYTNTKNFKKTNNIKRILFFGRIEEYKGLECLIEAGQKVSKRIPCKITIAGHGNIKPYIKYITDENLFEIDNYFIEEDKVCRYFQNTDLVVLPYKQASQSGVIALAYAFNIPVVSTRVGAIPEIVKDGKTGILVEPNNVNELSDAIYSILSNEDKYLMFRKNIKAYAEKDLSWKDVARKLYFIYLSAIDRKSKYNRQ